MRSLTAKRRPQHTVLMCEKRVLRPQRGDEGTARSGRTLPMRPTPLGSPPPAGGGRSGPSLGRGGSPTQLEQTPRRGAPIGREGYPNCGEASETRRARLFAGSVLFRTRPRKTQHNEVSRRLYAVRPNKFREYKSLALGGIDFRRGRPNLQNPVCLLSVETVKRTM